MRRNWRSKSRFRVGQPVNHIDSPDTITSESGHSSNSKSSSIASSSSKVSSQQLPIAFPIVPGNSTWKLYFPSGENKDEPETLEKLECFKNYIEKNRGQFDLEKIDQTRSIPLDVQNLLNDLEFTKGWTTFATDLFEKPVTTLRLLEYCFHEGLKCGYKIKVRILNHQPIIALGNLKVNYFEKLVTIKGTVIGIGNIGLICTSMAFECSNCHELQAVVQPQGIFTAPNFCQKCNKDKQYRFVPVQSSPFTITTDFQVAKIQEIQSQSISGTIPKSVEVELHGDLVATACPGDVLTVTGIVKVRGERKGGEDGKRAARLLQLYIEAVSVHSHRNLSNPTISFTLKDYYAIQKIHASEDVFRLLVHSLCPAIFGHEVVKAGLVLGLMGGTELDGGSRHNPHILIVGDPGLGKSQLLQAAAHAAPRGVYVCGASASAGGLTVGLGRESGGDFALEAGALVLADRGVCCVDELDKMRAHHSSLLEAMELQHVSVAKGGVVCSLAARATVLAAANPAAGSYNRAKTVAENLKLSSPLLSRFDLVFILLDQPDEKIDEIMSEHVLALHSGHKNKPYKSTRNISFDTSQYDNDASLSKRLRLKRGEVIDSLPTILLRKYIAYAKRYVHPQLSQEAANVLQNFYLELRHNHQSGSYDGTPITTRQLEACIRLTQARARVDLREEATEKDANDVICLIKHSLIDTFSDEFGNIQLSRSINGSGISSKNKLNRFLNAIKSRAHELGKDVFTRKELIDLHRIAGLPGDPDDLIQALNTHTYLLIKGSNVYQLID